MLQQRDKMKPQRKSQVKRRWASTLQRVQGNEAKR